MRPLRLAPTRNGRCAHQVTIGDRPATLLPYDVADLPDTPETCPEVPEQCIFLLGRGMPPDSFEFFVTENDFGRMWILEEQEPGMLIAGPAADDGAFATHTDELLATIAFHEPVQ